MSAVVLLVILLVVVAWLVAASMAVRSVSRIWLRHWAEQRLHGYGSSAADLFLERPQRLILAGGTGVALMVFLAGAVIGASSTQGARVAERVLLAALAVLLFGQVLPRAVSRRFATTLVPVLLPALHLVDLLFAPVNWIGRQLLRRGGPRAADFGSGAREGIGELLREGALEGVGERDEIAIITGVVEFGQKTVAEVMTPRGEIFALEAATPPADLARQVAAAGYSRVPLYDASLDAIVGMVHVFDVLKAGGEETPPVRAVARTAPATRINELLFEMLRKRLHLAIVQDDAGQTVGLVTLEDLLEELVGDIRDEYDEPPPPASAPAVGSLPAGRP